MSGFNKINLKNVKDSAKEFGYEGNHEARFAAGDLDLTQSGISLQRLHPGKRSPFGHTHDEQEEIYVIIKGSGRAKLGDETIDVKPYDAIRVAPETPRAFAAGEEGLEMLVFGPHLSGERDMGTILPDWWTE